MLYPIYLHLYGEFLVADFSYPASTELLVDAEMLVAEERVLSLTFGQRWIFTISVSRDAIDVENQAVGEDVNTIFVKYGRINGCGLVVFDATILAGKWGMYGLVDDVVVVKPFHDVYLTSRWPRTIVERHEPDGRPGTLSTLQPCPHHEPCSFASTRKRVSVACRVHAYDKLLRVNTFNLYYINGMHTSICAILLVKYLTINEVCLRHLCLEEFTAVESHA